MTGKSASAAICKRIPWPVGKITALGNVFSSDHESTGYRSVVGKLRCLVSDCASKATVVLCRGVAKLVKAPDFDSGIRRFESFHPCQISDPPRRRVADPPSAGLHD